MWWSHVRRCVRRHWVVSQKSSLSEPAHSNRLSRATVETVYSVKSVDSVGTVHMVHLVHLVPIYLSFSF